MGINIILPIIAGLIATILIGGQVAPSYMENIKIKKVENVTLANQEMVKDAIVRYIKLGYGLPENVGDLTSDGKNLLLASQTINSEGKPYKFTIDKKKGTLKIFTTINDTNAEKYFSNSFKFPNKPTCVELVGETCKDNIWETFYLLDEDTMASFPKPELASEEQIKEDFTYENLGNKTDKDGNKVVFKDGDKDYVVKVNPDKEGEFIVTEYKKNGEDWEETGKVVVVPSINNKEHGVRISDLTHSFKNGLGEDVTITHERVHCNKLEDGKHGISGDMKINDIHKKEWFVVNENTGIGEIVYVLSYLGTLLDFRSAIFDSTNGSIIRNPNNLCISNSSKDLHGTFSQSISIAPFNYDFFKEISKNFNEPLDRWDTSHVTKMTNVFQGAEAFNQDISSWDVEKVSSCSVFKYGSSLADDNVPQFNKCTF